MMAGRANWSGEAGIAVKHPAQYRLKDGVLRLLEAL